MCKADKPEWYIIIINEGKNRSKIKNQIAERAYHENGKNPIRKQFDFWTQKIDYFQNQKNRYRGNLEFQMVKQKRIHFLTILQREIH